MITLAIIIITVICSIIGFSNSQLINQLIFSPYAVTEQNQWYRFVTSGFIHADLNHLGFNMLTLYFFGKNWESFYIDYLGVSPIIYVVFYLLALIVSQIPSFLKNSKNYHYSSLGASGAVSAIVFSGILVMPWNTLYIFILPVPAIVYAIGFLFYSVYMGKKGIDNINHDAHFWGAIFGVVFSFIIKQEVISIFLFELVHPHFEMRPL
jgi:membrane associated rhomboid family serine protease